MSSTSIIAQSTPDSDTPVVLVWEKSPVKAARLAAALHDNGQHAEALQLDAHLAKNGRCINCGRKLNGTTSLTAGRGEHCRRAA